MTTDIVNIKVVNSYLGSFDLDDNDTVTPIIVAVSESNENVPYDRSVDGNVPTHNLEEAPVYEIEEVNVPAKATGKVNVVFSNKNYLEHIKLSNSIEIPQNLDGSKINLTKAEIERLFSETLAEQENETNADELVRFSVQIPLNQFLVFFSLNLTGESYIALFGQDGKPSRRNSLLTHDDLETIIALPEPDTEDFDRIATQVALIASENGMKTLHQIAPNDPNEVEKINAVRKEIYLLFVKIGFGSKEDLQTLVNYIPLIDEFYKRVVIKGSLVEKETDEKVSVIIELLEHIVAHSNPRRIAPRKLTPQEIIEFTEDFDEFDKITDQFMGDKDFADSLEELNEVMSLHDMTFVKEMKNTQAISAFVVSRISKGDLPKEMFHLQDELDKIHFFDTDWNNYVSIEKIVDEESPIKNKLGESLINATLAALVRMSRATSINNSSFIPLLTMYVDSFGPESNFWEFEAFTSGLARGDKEPFKNFLTSSPVEDSLAATVNSSALGAVLFAFVKTIVDEKWNKQLLEAGISSYPAVYDFVSTCYTDITTISEELHSNGQWDDLTVNGATEKQIIVSLSVEVIMSHLQKIDSYGSSLDQLVNELMGAMDAIADINTGRMTDKSYNSEDWLNVKEQYLNGMFNLDTKSFFKTDNK